MVDATPYRTTASGLLVPDDVSREREVWTRDEAKILDRAIKLLKARGLSVQLACPKPGCKGDKLEKVRHADGSVILQCHHKDRIFTGAF